MTYVSIGLITLGVLSLTLSLFWGWARTFLLILTFFALLNSYFAAPLSWKSFVAGGGFWLLPILPMDPPIPLQNLALPTESPETIMVKMGCHVCHKIPRIPQSRLSEYGPILIPGTTAPEWIKTKEYQDRVKAGRARATTAREYIMESILNPDAFVVEGYSDQRNPEVSLMYHHYPERFTQGALEKLTDYLLTLDVYAAVEDGLIFAHQSPPQ
jgi:hypothetical protein